jgi:two-component system response regulator AtoC
VDPSGSAGLLTLFVVTPAGMTEHSLPIRGRVTIGRGEGNAVRVDDASVSRRHAAIEVGDTVQIEDLGGANGTYVQRLPSCVSGDSTQNLRALRGDAATIGLGDRVVLGAVSLFVRRVRPRTTSDCEYDDEQLILDPHMLTLYAQVDRAAGSRVSVLLRGETGVGKELVARRIHARSPRRNCPFVALNCAALAETLLEAELFGAEKGSYTGASHARPGLFEAADKGTLFLDEIGELAMGTQAKLLRALEDRKVLRIGSRVARALDVRFVAASNRDLKRASEEGQFRADLYFRLAGIILEIPPLRDRPTEIEPLGRTLLERACRDIERPPVELSPEAIVALKRYPWPGNVRELKNAVEHAAVLCSGTVVRLEHLPRAVVTSSEDPPAIQRDSSADIQPGPDDPIAYRRAMTALEREGILRALERCNGNQTRAAEMLGMSRRTLLNRLDGYDVGRPRKRPSP